MARTAATIPAATPATPIGNLPSTPTADVAKRAQPRTDPAQSSTQPITPPHTSISARPEPGFWSQIVALFRDEAPSTPPPSVPVVTEQEQTGTEPQPAPFSERVTPVKQRPDTQPSQKLTLNLPIDTATMPPAPVDRLTLPRSTQLVLTSPDQKTEGPHLVALSKQTIAQTRAQLLANLSTHLTRYKIASHVDNHAGTLYLPGLLPFDASPTPDSRQKMHQLANVLANDLVCFSRDASQAEECTGQPGALKLDALVVVGHAGPEPIGTAAFRKNWARANTRALETFSNLLKAHPRIQNLRNTHNQSIFRLDGFLPSNPTNRSRPVRRIELRFVMEPPSIESQPRP